jgi:hypothetical protein
MAGADDKLFWAAPSSNKTVVAVVFLTGGGRRKGFLSGGDVPPSPWPA